MGDYVKKSMNPGAILVKYRPGRGLLGNHPGHS